MQDEDCSARLFGRRQVSLPLSVFCFEFDHTTLWSHLDVSSRELSRRAVIKCLVIEKGQWYVAEGSVNLSSDASLAYTRSLGVCRFVMLAFKSVWQYYVPSSDVLRLLDVLRRMANESVRIGVANDVSSLRKLSLLSYNQLARYDSPSYYKLCAISRAAGILAARKKSIRRGFPAKTPYAVRPVLISCYGFKIRNGFLEIPVARGRRCSIPLTKHTVEIISHPDVKVHSL